MTRSPPCQRARTLQAARGGDKLDRDQGGAPARRRTTGPTPGGSPCPTTSPARPPSSPAPPPASASPSPATSPRRAPASSSPTSTEAAARRRRLGLPGALSMQVDVADPAQVEAMVARAVAETGGLHLLVNNAGIGGPAATTGDYPLDGWTAGDRRQPQRRLLRLPLRPPRHRGVGRRRHRQHGLDPRDASASPPPAPTSRPSTPSSASPRSRRWNTRPAASA